MSILNLGLEVKAGEVREIQSQRNSVYKKFSIDGGGYVAKNKADLK